MIQNTLFDTSLNTPIITTERTKLAKKDQHFGNMHGKETGKDEWITPKYILDSFPEFDLDPCAPIERVWDMAKKHFTVEDDGLKQDWTPYSRVWMNPPYGNETGKWMQKLAKHGSGIALIFARTETRTFFDYIWDKADAILFIKGRLKFCHVTGEPADNCGGAPSCLVAYGEENANDLRNCGIKGKFLYID